MSSLSSYRGLRFAPRLEGLEGRTVPATFTVRNLADAGAGSLRQAVLDANAAPGADVIRFAPAARGTVTLTSGELAITDDVRIDGPGAGRLAVSGNDTSRVFNIAAGADVAIDDLTVTRGRALLQGGGIRNAGTLTLSHAVVSDNVVVGLPGATPTVDAMGGGIRNTGTLTVRHTVFVGNQSLGAAGDPGGPGSTGLGGAIMSAGTPAAPAAADISHSTFVGNRAVGGAAGAGAAATRAGLGGAVLNATGSLTVRHSLFRDNEAVGGAGGAAGAGALGFGAGGAIANGAFAGSATLAVSDSTFAGNRAAGGATGAGTVPQAGRGGAIANFVSAAAPLPVAVTATATVTRSTLLGNQAVGGPGTVGGAGQGGGIANLNGALTVSDSLLALNRADGGDGGGDGQGGGIFNGGPAPLGTPTLALLRSVVALNRADGGSGQGGLFLAPGGVAVADPLTVFLANDVVGDLGDL